MATAAVSTAPEVIPQIDRASVSQPEVRPVVTLIENKLRATERCLWCDALRKPHSRACPLGERYKQVQSIGGVPFVGSAA